ncbi:MAG: hypothetical protein KC636_04595 [Myxococcales bacterium]|nr:hypothetical protein [Myxococcales bacterium]
MDADPRWAARYTFLRELWEDRPRLFADPELIALARGGARQTGSLATLLDELLPRRRVGASVWLWGEGTLARAGPRRVDDLAATLADAPWEFAAVALSAVDPAARAPVLAALSAGAARGAAVAMFFRTGEGDDDDALDELAALAREALPSARLYAFAPSRCLAAYDCGLVADDDDDDDASALTFDNSLGEAPRLVDPLALAAPTAPTGTTLIELPGGDADDPKTLRGQLSLARRQLEVGAIAREQLTEQLDAALAQVDDLTRQRDALQRQLAARAPERVTLEGRPAELVAGREDALRAALTAARAELSRTRDERDALIQRPVDALEAELAALRHALARQLDRKEHSA